MPSAFTKKLTDDTEKDTFGQLIFHNFSEHWLASARSSS